MNRSLKRRVTRNPGQPGTELENHFILRLLEPQAKILREVLRSNQSSNIKDRLHIQLDHTQDKDDMRNGVITIDTIMYRSRLVDVPTIIESWKTIDGKNFYKTADICQMLMVRDGEDPQEEEESKKKRKDHPNRVDKKYLWPHGYTPPLKNVRKRRFRKMLRKKILELPEIEKEVKRLLRADEEALSVKWEVLREDEEKGGSGAADFQHQGGHDLHQQGGQAPANLDEQLFGEMVSSSEDEVGPINIMDEDEDSRLSVDDSRMSDHYTGTGADQLSNNNTLSPSHPFPSSSAFEAAQQQHHGGVPAPAASYVTEFNPSMFQTEDDSAPSLYQLGGDSYHHDNSSSYGGRGDEDVDGGDTTRGTMLLEDSMSSAPPLEHLDRATLQSQMASLEADLATLAEEQRANQAHIDGLDNSSLRSRFLYKLREIRNIVAEKESMIRRVRAALSQ